MKLIAFGVRGYFKQRWNVFDFCLVLGAYVGFASSLPSIATLLRVFRVLRVVRLARGSKAMLQVRGLRRQRLAPCLRARCLCQRYWTGMLCHGDFFSLHLSSKRHVCAKCPFPGAAVLLPSSDAWCRMLLLLVLCACPAVEHLVHVAVVSGQRGHHPGHDLLRVLRRWVELHMSLCPLCT